MKALSKYRTFSLLLLILCFPGALPAEASDYRLTPVTPKIQVIYGSLDLPDARNRGFRNNVVVVETSAGLVLFDPGGSAYAGERIAERVAEHYRQPVVAVINSHVHGDHWLGNEGIRRHFPEAVIYAHPRMKQRLEAGEGQRWLDTLNRVTGGTAGGVTVTGPDRTLDEGDRLMIGDTEFRLLHPGAAHTDCDLMIEVVGEQTLFTGDVVRNGLLGIMEEDASFEGNIDAIDGILAGRYAHYIPGHGAVGDAGMLLGYRNYLSTLREGVARLYEEGLSDFEMRPQVIEALSDYRDWAGFDLRIGAHINRAYLEIEKAAFE